MRCALYLRTEFLALRCRPTLSPNMVRTLLVLGEGLGAARARVWFLACVFSHVDEQLVVLGKGLAALNADVRSFPGVAL